MLLIGQGTKQITKLNLDAGAERRITIMPINTELRFISEGFVTTDNNFQELFFEIKIH